jgi:hypothetical protein
MPCHLATCTDCYKGDPILEISSTRKERERQHSIRLNEIWSTKACSGSRGKKYVAKEHVTCSSVDLLR